MDSMDSMPESKPTPGRWEVGTQLNVFDPEMPTQWVVTVTYSSGVCRHICTISGTDQSVFDESGANARLIAAAPRLLEAAKAALDEYEGSDADPEFCPAMGLLRAAIKAAEGGAK